MSTCGTGNANLPLPGDPNTNTVVTVTNTALGLLVSWTYPSVNAGAVAHFQLHRSTSFSDPNPALYKIVTGDSYLDVKQDLTVGTTYFYWIRVVSVSGVIGPLQGPGSVTGESAIADIISAMSGQIRVSELHNDLTTKIGILDTLKIQIDGSYLLTTPDYDALLASLADLNTANADLQVAIQDEITLRATNEGTLLTAIDGLAIVDGDNAAAILAETNLRVSEDAVLANHISTLQATLTHPTTGLSAVGTVTNQTKIDLEATNDGVSALVTQTDTLQAVVEHPDTGLAAVSSIAVNAEVTADIAADGVVSLGSKYTVKLDSNGHVAGFGLANTPNLDNGSNTSAFEVNADRFSIGHPGSGDSDVPFYVQGGQTYITDAFIKNASITNAKIGNFIQSDNYSPGVAGWKITKDGGGTGEFNNLTARATINGGSINIGSGNFVVNSDGDLIANNAYIRGNIEATSISGAIVGTDKIVNNAVSEIESVLGATTDLAAGSLSVHAELEIPPGKWIIFMSMRFNNRDATDNKAVILLNKGAAVTGSENIYIPRYCSVTVSENEVVTAVGMVTLRINARLHPDNPTGDVELSVPTILAIRLKK